MTLETFNFKSFLKKFVKQKNNFYFYDLNVKINDALKSLVSVEKIKFANYGYKKNVIEGNIFGKKFKTKIDSLGGNEKL